MEALPVVVSGSLYKSVLAMIKEIKKLVIKLTQDGVSCSPSVIQMFDKTKRWFMDRVKVLKNVICSGDGVRPKKCFCNSKTADL
jgi:hypothetical protein